jgi:arginyl-tRNA synthetase
MLHQLIEQRLRAAVQAVLPDATLESIQVRPCPDPKFGHYQSNALMALAKARRLNPRQLANDVAARLDVTAWCEAVEVAGAGFLNFRLRPEAIAAALHAALAAGHPFVARAATPRTVVVDFSSPNVAKPMHVGHIRSTILGNSLARTLRLLGHRVITDNHLGDWGTQFGKLLVGWKKQLDRAALGRDPVAEMERLYRSMNAASEADPAVLEAARQELVRLQAGDPENLAIWREMIALSQAQFDTIYTRLGVKFDHTFGESFYNPRLQGVVSDLVTRGIARESEGAKVVFFDDVAELKAHPAIVQKSDSGFNYATTDLATLAYRLETWQPDEIIYVTDGRQQLHFRQIFAAFRRGQPDAARVRLAHVWFGSILGEGGKPFKTRAGDTVKLADLLDEAEERALRVVTEKNPELPDGERREIARIVGIGAVKYQDLLPNRQSDYVFSWDKMLALSGNTAPYLQYAVTRLQSILRKAGTTETAIPPTDLRPASPEEMQLARHLLNFGLVLEAVAEEYRPNYLCNHLYELAGHFTTFYERCPVLKADGADRARRLALCDLTGRVLRQGLDLLGIETPERM